MDERDVGAGPAVAERHLERVEDQRGAHVGRQLPAHHLAAVGVEHEAEEHQPLPAAQVGQVGDPQLVRPADREVALHQVGPAVGQRVVRHGLPRRLAPWIPWPRINLCTRQRGTRSPSLSSAFQVRR